MFQKAKERLEEAVSPSREHISGIRADMDARLRALKTDRAEHLQETLETDFHFVLTAWGIFSTDELPNAIRDLRLRLAVFGIPVLLACVLFYQGFDGGAMLFVASFLCLVVSLTGLLTTCWRLHVLKHRHFLPFRRWLFTFFKQ